MHPSVHSGLNPDKLAITMAGFQTRLTYKELDDRSNQVAQFFRRRGLKDGDCVAILMENRAEFFPICWGAQRSGLYYACISTKLTAEEAKYIVRDCDARILVGTQFTADLCRAIQSAVDGLEVYLCEVSTPPFPPLKEALDPLPTAPIEDEAYGVEMLYSSGTTGRPKGVKPDRPSGSIAQPTGLTDIGARIYGMGGNTVFLSPAPLYHAAPLRWCMTAQRLGGSVVAMEHFDAEATLRLIHEYRITHAQFVPTHFVRMLKLPQETRDRYDVSSLQAVFHAAAPCPVPVKEAMIEWWGPIIHEYYAGTESNGYTAITSEEWLTHKGSVGRAVWGQVQICDGDDNPLPPRSEGLVYFANGPKFTYHNAPEQTASATNRYGWTTLGDIGWLDEEGYLYLTDRKSFTIISGGVNVYPQEVENLLITHPKVADVAVIGVPDEDLGEKVIAIVQPTDWADAGDALARQIIDFARPRLSKVKLPRAVHFIAEMPRLPTGKLPKHALREIYSQASTSSA